MPRVALGLLAGGLVLVAAPARSQTVSVTRAPADSTRPGAEAPKWSTQVRYGGGPSVGAPRSDFTGEAAPERWCLVTDAPGAADMSRGRSWRMVSRGWLRRILSDTTDFGETWRRVLGGAPTMSPADSLTEVTDETICRAVAGTLSRELLGWPVGPPPVTVMEVRGYLFAFPSNAWMGEFGYAVGMDRTDRIRGVGTW